MGTGVQGLRVCVCARPHVCVCVRLSADVSLGGGLGKKQTLFQFRQTSGGKTHDPNWGVSIRSQLVWLYRVQLIY